MSPSVAGLGHKGPVPSLLGARRSDRRPVTGEGDSGSGRRGLNVTLP